MSPLGLAVLAIASVGWGLNFPIMKHLLTERPPLSLRGLCGIVGAAALALFALARHEKLSVPRAMWLRLLLVSMLTIGGWVAFMGLALLWLNASEAAVLGISIPVWVAFLAWPILGERLSPLRGVSLTVALAGIAVLIGGSGFEASIEKLPGIAFALAGAVCVGLGAVLTKHFPLAMPPLSLAAWQSVLPKFFWGRFQPGNHLHPARPRGGTIGRGISARYYRAVATRRQRAIKRN